MLLIYFMLSIYGLCQGRKNVLFLVSDDMRPQLNCYSGGDFPSTVHPYMHTPNLDNLAKKSLLLKRAYTQQAVCSPSRTSLLTGRRPDTTHVYNLVDYFRKVGGNYTTLPEYFKFHGYQTIGMGKIFHPGKASGYDDPVSWSEPYFHGKHNHESQKNSWKAVPDDLLKKSPLVDQQLLEHAKKTLRRVSQSDKPFFVAVGFHKPHLPFVFPKSFLQYYPKTSISLPPNPYAPVNMPKAAWYDYSGLRGYGDIKELHVSGHINTTLPDETTLELRRAYYAAISYTDSLIGKLLKELDILGLTNNTIVSFCTHAPMMIHVPGVTGSGIQTEQLTEFVDLFPTLVEAAMLPALDLCPRDATKTALCREGTSLFPLMKNPDVPLKSAVFSQYPRVINIDENPDNKIKVMGYTMRTDKYRYTEWAEFDFHLFKPHWDKLHGVELYDHIIDPEENNNRASNKSYKFLRAFLSEKLHAGWRNATLVQY